ncbi:glutathione peroxidase 7-like [Centruroides vittatus]|uniref:glutathione peroxidase 7-like n=1 Tax=Centruroides vittatus TaxID=120091 RepID=UPI003510C449
MRKFLSFVILLFTLCNFINADDRFYKLSAIDTNGNEVQFEEFRGKVVLIVNVATYCGFTKDHYTELVKLQNILGYKKNLIILAFPCNQFGQQEPDSDKEINEFVQTVYKINFLLFKKIDVIGENIHPVFQFLFEESGKQPNWNFWKYLIDHSGNFLNAWSPFTSVSAIFEDVKSAVEKADHHAIPLKEL